MTSEIAYDYYTELICVYLLSDAYMRHNSRYCPFSPYIDNGGGGGGGGGIFANSDQRLTNLSIKNHIHFRCEITYLFPTSMVTSLNFKEWIYNFIEYLNGNTIT